MAKSVFTTEEITLQDGTTVMLKPSRIKRLRKLMRVWESMSQKLQKDGADDDKTTAEKFDEDLWLDTCLYCAGIALVPEITRLTNVPNAKIKIDVLEDENGNLTEEYQEWIEDTLDIDSMYKVLEVCAKLKLNDPKLEEQIQAMMREQAGPTSTSQVLRLR